ncbi:type II toxin-antitoxin system RelE/ParE family toxin [Crenothrix sp.]|uniref:type II toxin-antitoxin system RelE/ParE family toxin n=1 Tax=Crenothrix sp. TaxID=3100433 RepID=UPI00374DF9B5
MGNYKITEAAKEDLRRIYHRGIREYSEIQADKYYDALFNRFDQIAENPYLYQPVDYIRAGYRRCVCGVDSIYYRMGDNTVEIINILGRQNIDEIF